jgi:uncharacterized protein (DUF1697 family)
MVTFISMLRGINVGGNKKIGMPELKKVYEDSGFKDVQTFIQSGNVLFKSKQTDERKLADKIENGINKKFGFEVKVLIRTPGELQKRLGKCHSKRKIPEEFILLFYPVSRRSSRKKKSIKIRMNPKNILFRVKRYIFFARPGMAKQNYQIIFLKKS